NACELLRAAWHKTKRGILELIAERFPQADVRTSVRPVGGPVHLASPRMTASSSMELEVAPSDDATSRAPMGLPVPEPVIPSPERMRASGKAPPFPGLPSSSARATPLSPERYALQAASHPCRCVSGGRQARRRAMHVRER